MKHLFSLFFFLLMNKICFSQNEGLKYGLYFGAGEAKIKNAAIENQTGKPALNIGFASNYQITNNFGLVADLLFTSKGSKAPGSVKQCCQSYQYIETYRFYYAEIPVMAKGSIHISDLYIKVFSGPSVNFNLRNTQTRIFNDTLFNKENGFRNKKITGLNLIEFSWVSGAGFEVQLEDDEIIFLEIRNNIALSTIGTINDRNTFNNYFSIGIGYLY